MGFTGAGAVWSFQSGKFYDENHSGDLPGVTAAYAATTAGGSVLVGPGMEAISLAGLPALASLVRVTNTGIFGVARFHVLDPTDPTKAVTFDVSAVSGTKTVTVPNRSGYLLLPATEGTDGYHLRSKGAGAAPVWEAVTAPTNTLLDGSNHTDTIARSVSVGDLILGVAGAPNKWDRLTIGANGTVLSSDGTTASWQAPVSSATHDGLPDTNTVAVASCTWTGATNQITAAAGSFSNVKPGWFIYCGANSATTNWGRTVVSVSLNGDTITASATNGGSTLSAVPMYFVTGDHWQDSLSVDTVSSATCTGAGLLLTAGRGDYTASGGTTFQELRGPIRWMGAAGGGMKTDFRVNGSNGTSTGQPAGFMLMKQASGTIGTYFHTNDLSGIKVLRLGDFDTDRQIVVQTTNGSSIGYDTVFGNDSHTARRTFQTPNINATVTGVVKSGDHTITSNLATQTLTSPPQGMYRFSFYCECTAATSGSVSYNVNWTDSNGAQVNGGTYNIGTSGVGWNSAVDVMWVQSGNVTYDTTGTWAGTIKLHVRIEAI